MKTGINDPFLTARIVRSYVRHNKLGVDQIADLIKTVHRAIGQLGQPREPEMVRTPAVPVRQSVRRDYVICLDCGYQGKTLRRHISISHGLNGDEYRRRWGLLSDHPLTAPAYSEHRSMLAKELGLGRKSTTAVVSAPTPVASSPEDVASNTNPRRTRRSRRTSKPEDTASEAAATSTRRRRSRSVVAPQAEQTTPSTDPQSQPI